MGKQTRYVVIEAPLNGAIVDFLSEHVLVTINITSDIVNINVKCMQATDAWVEHDFECNVQEYHDGNADMEE